jgi:hypothetical protein
MQGAIVKRTPKAVLSLFCSAIILAGAPSAALAQVASIHLPGEVGLAPIAVPAIGASALANPALGGVSSFMGAPSLAAPAPTATAPAAAPSAALSAAAAPAAAAPVAAAPAVAAAAPAVAPAAAVAAPGAPILPAAAAASAANDAKSPAGSLGSARALASRVAPASGEQSGGARAAGASRAFFDQAAAASDDSAVPESAGSAAAAPAPDALGRLYPRVVVILDTLEKPAEPGDKIVSYIEALADKGVRVIFATARAEKGENSAESVLISKLKNRTGNPIIVASYNGARIAAHNSKAANPKPLIPDQLPLAEPTLARFREIAETVKQKLGIHAKGVEEFGQPSLEAPYIYGARVPQGADAAAWVAAYNRALKAAGFVYKMELGQDAEGRAIYYTQANSLKLNAGRLFNALYAAAPELNPENGGSGVLKPGQVLVLGDPAKAPGFLRSLPGRGHFIHGVTDTASVERALGAVLGLAAFEQVSVNKYQLREYLDWLERRQTYGPSSAKSAKGRAGSRWKNPDSAAWHTIAFYRGIVVKEVMSRLYHQMKNGAYSEATLDAAVIMLNKLWRYPDSNGLRLPEELQLARQTSAFKSASRGGLEGAERWLKNYYHRHFPDFPRNVNEKVAGRLLRLARDGDSVTLNYSSPFTRRSYKVFVRPDRTELWEDEKGYILVGHVYRTGREPFQAQFDESIEVNLVGRALLEGDAQKRADGHWYVNGQADPRVMVVFHYNTRDLQEVFTPAQIESQTPEVTALIEKREADKEYQKWLDEREKEAEKARVNLKRTITREANAKAKQPAPRDPSTLPAATKQAAADYLNLHEAGIREIPGVATVSLGRVAGPRGAEPAVIVAYRLGSDPESIRSQLPEAPGAARVAVKPAFTPKEAASAYRLAHEDELLAIPGVVGVSLGLTTADKVPGVIVRCAPDADPEAIRAALPQTPDGVKFELKVGERKS